MTPLTGTYEGRDYEIEPFPTDDGVRAWFVQRDGGERHEVRVNPADCSCGDFEWRRKGLLPIPCVHVRALRHLLKGVNDEGRRSEHNSAAD